MVPVAGGGALGKGSQDTRCWPCAESAVSGSRESMSINSCFSKGGNETQKATRRESTCVTRPELAPPWTGRGFVGAGGGVGNDSRWA